MHHQTIEPSHWIERYPLDAHLAKLDAEGRPAFVYRPPNEIFTVEDLAHAIQFLQRATEATVPLRSTEIDLFLPALGEPPTPHETKISGVPYLRNDAWPVNKKGEPLAFVGQICFADSLDVLPFSRERLGGDVLLLFQDQPDEMIWSMTDGAPLHFLWMPLGIPQSELIRVEDAYVPSGWLEPTHFHRMRMTEYPEYSAEIRHGELSIPVFGDFRATKLGGLPLWQQDESDGHGLGTYFGCLHSINPYGSDYPMINVPSAPWGSGYSDRNLLMLGDVGTLYLFLQDDGRINWVMQCG